MSCDESKSKRTVVPTFANSLLTLALADSPELEEEAEEEEEELDELDAVVAVLVDELCAELVASPVVVEAVSQAARNAVAVNKVNKRFIIFLTSNWSLHLIAMAISVFHFPIKFTHYRSQNRRTQSGCAIWQCILTLLKTYHAVKINQNLFNTFA